MNESATEPWTTCWDSAGSEQDSSSNTSVDTHGTGSGELRSSRLAKAFTHMRSQLKIQCIICKKAILIDNFSDHIDSCGRNNRETQEVMKNSLDRILRHFTPLVQRKPKESEFQATNDTHNVKRLRSGNISLDPNRRYENVRRGRSKNLSLNSSEKGHDSSQFSCGPWRVTEEKIIASSPKRSPPRLINTDVTTPDDSLLLKNTTFSCSLCSYTTFKEVRLQKHESLHRIRKSKVVQCFYCSQRYTSGSIVVHIREVHPGLECRFINMDGAEVTRLACPKCTYKCLLKVQLKNHMRREHGVKTAGTQKKILRKLTIVLKRENLEAVKSRLDQLRKTDSVEIESPQHSISTTSADEENFLECSSVNEFGSREETDDCITSDFTMASPRQHKSQHAVYKHQNNVKGKVKLPCILCSTEFSSMISLKSHMRTHLRNPSMQKCSKCTFQSSTRCLISHIKKSGHYNGPLNSRIFFKKIREESKLPAAVNSTPIDETRSASDLSRKETVQSDAEVSNGLLSESNVLTSTVSPNATESDKQSEKDAPEQKCTSPVRTETIFLKEDHADITFGDDDSEALNGDDEDERLLMKCTFCSFVCTKPYMYKRHLDNHVRLNMPILRCQFCKFTGTKYGFRGHQSRCAGYRTLNCAWKAPQEILLNCSGCAFSTNLPGELNAHIQNCKV